MSEFIFYTYLLIGGVYVAFEAAFDKRKTPWPMWVLLALVWPLVLFPKGILKKMAAAAEQELERIDGKKK